MARRILRKFEHRRRPVTARTRPNTEPTGRITLIDYHEEGVHEERLESIRDCLPYKEKTSTTWIDISGLEDKEMVRDLAEIFSLHPLTVEDILDTDQRPKFEEFEEYVLIIVKKPVYDPVGGEVDTNQVSIILTPGTVISFHQSGAGVMAPLRARIGREWSRIRAFGADYLAYALVDSIVDDYFIVLESCEERVEATEKVLIGEPSAATMKGIHSFKQELNLLRRSVWPLREVVAAMQRANSPLLDLDIKAYTKDLQENIIQIMDVIEIFRDSLSGMLDLHLSTMSHYTNQVMKTLTMMASLFIPLTMITGIYGMNFNYMPELQWRYGYPACLGMMTLIALSMLIYFKRKRWI